MKYYMRNVAIIVFLCSLITYWIASDRGNYIYRAKESELYKTDSGSISNWAYSTSLYFESEVNQGRKFSADSMGIKESDLAEIKLIKIAEFLIDRFQAQLGSPSASLRESSPWQQFLLLTSDTSLELYCTHYSAMYAFFARINGLSCREIECKGKNDLHIFNEIYIPSAHKWVYSDLTHGIPFLLKNGAYQSTLELYSNLHSQFTEPLVMGDISSDPVPKFLTLEERKKMLYNFDAQCEFHYYQNANLDITPKPIFQQSQPVILVYANKFIYYKWPLLKWISITTAMICFLVLFRMLKPKV